MRLKTLIPGALVLLFIFALLYQVNKQASVVINAPLLNVYKELYDTVNWKKWNTDLRDENNGRPKHYYNHSGFDISTLTNTVRVTFLDALTFGVKSNNKDFVVTLLPGKYDKSTTLLVKYKSKLLYTLWPLKADRELEHTVIDELKSYLENPTSYYGANFKKVRLSDMNMMVYKSIVDSLSLFQAIRQATKALFNRIPKDDLTDTNKIYAQFIPLNNHKIMFVGVPVKRQLTSFGNLTYMHIPAQRAIVSSFNGKYKERTKLYSGVNAYIHDHALKSAMEPIEVFSTDDLPLADTSQVNMQIIFSAY